MKIRSLLVIILMVALASIAPVNAHFTLGNLIHSDRFHSDDFDTHLAGPLAYVWPGGGLSSYTGFGDRFPPGYQSPYPGGKPGGPGINGPGGVSLPNPGSSWYQLESDAYAPFGAVLAGSTGDLIFAINATKGFKCNVNGQLGDGTTTDRHTPVQIMPTNITAIAAGTYHSLFMYYSGGYVFGGDLFYGGGYVYAMGQEPWLNYVMSVKYTPESHPIVQSNKLLESCAQKGIVAERLFGEKEILLAA
jgi:hypothetical protein